MPQEIVPIAVRPWTHGISERMIVSHYENNYGESVRTLNAVRAELAALDARAPAYRLRALKHEELIAMSSVTLHELYFGNLGGQGIPIPDLMRAMGPRPNLVAIGVLGMVLALLTWTVVFLVSRHQYKLLAAVLAVAMAALIALIAVIGPAYWD
jgi:hypothetical protein